MLILKFLKLKSSTGIRFRTSVWICNFKYYIGGSESSLKSMAMDPRNCFTSEVLKICFTSFSRFTATSKIHHCRACGEGFCSRCSNYQALNVFRPQKELWVLLISFMIFCFLNQGFLLFRDSAFANEIKCWNLKWSLWYSFAVGRNR